MHVTAQDETLGWKIKSFGRVARIGPKLCTPRQIKPFLD
jgi:hypothetical protein